ncbi:MAG: choice-of-anchor D domain-containing protein [bacterium]|nr:choice-of-anchor D domain-containing protein [bacterium]
MRPLFILLLLVSVVLGADGQSLQLYNVNASRFPTIRADYVAVDANGRPFTGLGAADFRIVEQPGNGAFVDLSATVVHGCRTLTRDSAASILLIIDESASMANPVGGVQRMDLVKAALRTFIGQLNFTTGTQVCIIAFSGYSRLALPWSGSTSVILDSISRLSPKTVTNYELPFTSIPNIFDEFAKRDPSIPKTAIFITDDQPNPAIVNPQNLIDTVVRKSYEQAIVIHSISVDETLTNPTLATICTKTGGTSHFGTESLLTTMFDLINFSINSRIVCYIEWKSPFGCSEFDRQRTAIATLLRPNTPPDTITYTTGAASIAVINSSTPLLELGSPPASSSLFASVTFASINTDVMVRGYTISPATHFTVVDWDYPKNSVNPPSPTNIITLRKNVPRVLRVRLTQGSIPALHTAILQLIGDPCTITQALRGGGTQVVVVTPNGGEVLTTCDTADILWSGIPADAPVRIQWSIDGTTWNTIANAATGRAFRWLPTIKGLTYRIRITYVPISAYTWLQQIGHTGIDTASSVAARPGGDKLYVTGWFSGTTQFGGASVTLPQGAVDGFCQEFDGDGLWGRTFLLTGEDSKNEKIIGAVTDDIGNVYIAGTFESPTATLTGGTSNYTLRMPAGQSGSVRDVSDMFLAKITAVGAVEWVRFGQGTFRYSSEATATSIGIMKGVNGQTQVVVGGTFVSFINVGVSKGGVQMQLGPALPPGPFYAAYDELGNVIEVFARTPPTAYRYASKTTKDSTGCEFEVDHFTGTLTKGAFSATARSASTDVFVARRCVGPTAVDESDTVFTVRTPFLTISGTPLVMQPTSVGASSTTSFTQKLCNTDAYPAQVFSSNISGANAADFTLVTIIAGTIIQPNECLDIDIQFRPSAQGTRTAVLNVIGSCGTLASGALEGNGVSGCSLFVIGKVQMSDVVVGSTTTTNQCIVRNTTTANVSVTVRVSPAGTRFDVNPKGPIVLTPGQCFSPTITFDATTATPGNYNASLVYTLPPECGALSSEILAGVRDTTIIAKDTAISIDDLDWFSRRLRTVNDSIMYLRNQGRQDLFIESVALGNVAGDITADFALFPATPFLLKSKESFPIPVRFVPQTRGPHTTEVVVTVRGINTPVKGLARGLGILPVIAATGDTWPVTPILSVATKTGNVTIRNTDATTSLRIENVVFVRPTQSDFRWAIPSATLFPAVIPPNGSLLIPVQFVPQASGVRSEMVRIYHDAKEGPDPIPPFADTSVELLGSGSAGDELTPVAFPPTLTCDTAIASFWVPNPSATVPFLITDLVESDLGNAFELLGLAPITIPPNDSVQLFVRFSPSVKQTYAATYVFTNASIPGLYIRVTGEGTTTELTPAFTPMPDAAAGSRINIPLTVAPSAPYYSGMSSIRIDMQYPSLMMSFINVQSTSATGSITAIDTSVMGHVIFTVDVAPPVGQDLTFTTFFQTLLSADTVVDISAAVSSAYTCVNTLPASDQFILALSCAGASRVISLGASAFELRQPFPSPASDVVTVQYSTGYSTAVTFDVLDGIGNIVNTIALPASESAAYELDVPVNALASGTYVLRMRAGHYVRSHIISVVR